jgi:preprotein translocase subunit YajC
MSFLTTFAPAADKPAASGLPFGLDPLTIGLVLLLVVMVIFMVRNSRKRKRDAEEQKSKFVPGAEVMTQHGIFGTIISIDDEKNEVILETTPGTRLRVHRQTISRIVEPQDIDPEKDVVAEEPEAERPTGEPAFGERVTSDAEVEAPAKPARAPRTSSSSSSALSGTAASTSSTAKPRTPRKKPATDE